MSKEVLVLGAGMVGICTAIHLQQQGYAVTVIDQSAPGTETCLWQCWDYSNRSG